ncbi:hypothetical protein HMPREF1210_01232 [Paenisporosarcina sp. HGH0030]|uniref:hypothetical protein n=1 Tax=Paenisporosarcina sp. HGH0030 TaxID=1078085 RepID=UPI00034E5086|nr:hypothetical protein [Paenisporosarcina sp. HGH0030]EPD52852.1 hypothetical protein HMPREF1210_01232 [Paenisporosarcina sp. HGH0030]
MFLTIFFYIMAPLLAINFARTGIHMINGKFVEELEQTLEKNSKLRFLNTIFIFGFFVILLKMIFPLKVANVLIKIVYFTLGILFVILALLMMYIIITDGNSIISEVRKDM